MFERLARPSSGGVSPISADSSSSKREDARFKGGTVARSLPGRPENKSHDGRKGALTRHKGGVTFGALLPEHTRESRKQQADTESCDGARPERGGDGKRRGRLPPQLRERAKSSRLHIGPEQLTCRLLGRSSAQSPPLRAREHANSAAQRRRPTGCVLTRIATLRKRETFRARASRKQKRERIRSSQSIRLAGERHATDVHATERHVKPVAPSTAGLFLHINEDQF